MTFLRRALRALPLMFALLLSACGGGGDAITAALVTAPVSNAPGIRIGEPSPAAFATVVFVTRARLENCSDIRNRLYVIDKRMVLWDRAGNCPDNGHAQILFGADVDTVLCSASDSIAGPLVSCKDPADRALFDTIRQNLGRTDLGLAATHSVVEVNFLPRDGAAIAFEALFNSGMSAIVAPRQVVVRDAAEFAILWQQHGASLSPAPGLPKVDFTTQMVIALFAGASAPCHDISLQRVFVSGDKLVAEYQEHDAGPGVACIAAQTSPMQLSVVKRSDAALEFRRVSP